MRSERIVVFDPDRSCFRGPFESAQIQHLPLAMHSGDGQGGNRPCFHRSGEFSFTMTHGVEKDYGKPILPSVETL